ncbi:hypothetical protein P368_19275 [Comamonas thiooxydans]|nr:hypothetical protein P365_24000 [Comamonas thiooxydans]KGH09228.1 hypothetical protein P368_19275 [Comamonas thiooxydans]
MDIGKSDSNTSDPGTVKKSRDGSNCMAHFSQGLHTK